MKVHVGIHPTDGKMVAIYQNKYKSDVVRYKINIASYSNVESVEQMFSSIKKHIPKNFTLGFACIFMPEIYDQAKKDLLRLGLQCGFQKVQVVDRFTLECVDAISQNDFLSENYGIVKIYCSDGIYVWEKNMVRAKCVFVESYYFHWDALAITEIKPHVVIIEECCPKIYDYHIEKEHLHLDYTTAGENSSHKINQINTATKTEKSISEKVENLHIHDIPTKTENKYSFPSKSLTNNSDVSVVGIDLGTSRCCIAVNRKSGITTIPLDNTGERLLPSYVAFDEEHVKCGQIVVERLRHHAKSTVFDSKRIIGRSINELEIDSIWPFKLIDQNEKLYLEITYFNGPSEITAEQVSAELLKFMKNAQKSATKEAAKLAGWKNITFLPEPIASSFAYFIDRPIPNNSTVLLFDLGGGTLDVCIFKIQNSQINIISNIGDTKLGGRDFDTVLINHFKNILGTKFGISMIKDKRYKLMVKCQKLKETLSVMASCGLDVDEFDTNQDGIITITRKEFESITKPLLHKIRNTVNAALFDSGFASNQINKVLHVGGGSRMPMIKQLLNDLFPLAEHCVEEHPDEVVAIGAAYYAYCNTLDLSF